MSNVDEIKKLKKLLDDGVITQEDFNNQKKKILNLNTENTLKKEEPSLNTLDSYKSKLINELAEENSSIEEFNEFTNENENKENKEYKEDNQKTSEAEEIYNAEKAKEKARLDALSEKKKEKNAEINKTINKGFSKILEIFKWIIAIFCWIMCIGSIITAIDQNPIVYVLTGILFLILGVMACPAITKKTQTNYKTYTKYKTIIVIIIIVLMLIVLSIG